MRTDLQYADYVSHSLCLPQCEDMRDNKAIARITEGYLKLLFPDLNLTDEEFIEYCVNPAVRMRQQIRDELAKMDEEYKWVTIKSEHPDEFQATHPDTKPEPAPENGNVDPFSPKRQPVEMSLDLVEGQRGMSYERLFAPYLRGAKRVKIVDPYIRYDYQLHNLINFCEFIAPEQYDIELTLITAADSPEQGVELSAKLNELKGSLVKDHIVFSYRLERGLHDRFIETDTGWRVILGRGLDIFQKPEVRFSLGFIDQTRRRCKPTTITFAKSKS